MLQGSTEITAAEVLQMLEAGEPFTLVDVRDRQAYGASHIKGALSMPFMDYSLGQIAQALDPADNIIVYCYMGHASLQLTQELQRRGFPQVRSMSGGYGVWQATPGSQRFAE